MKIFGFLTREHIFVDLKPGKKEAVIEEFVQALKRRELIQNEKDVLSELLKRESLGSTGLEKGIAIPHALIDEVRDSFLALAVIPEGIDFEAVDQMPTYVLMLLLGSKANPGGQLKTLAHICRLVKETDFIEKVKTAESPDSICAILESEEAKIS